MDPNKPLEERVGHSLLVVRLIGVAKLFKVAVLLVVGFFILHVLQVHGNAHDILHDFVNAVRLDPNNHYIHGLLEKAMGIKDGTLRLISAGTLIYAGLYTVEGIGLCFDKGWAEWMTVVTTAGFIPFELYEVSRDPTPGKLLIVVLNFVILVYIAMRLRWRHLRKVQLQQRALLPVVTEPAKV